MKGSAPNGRFLVVWPDVTAERFAQPLSLGIGIWRLPLLRQAC